MFTEHLWDIKYWIKFFECRISFSMFTTTSRVVLLTCPFYRWGNEVLENSVICLRSNSLWVAGAEFAFSWSRPRAHALCHQAALISFRSWLGFISMVVFRLTWSSPQVLLYESCGSTTLCGYVVCWQRPACLWWEVWTYTDEETKAQRALVYISVLLKGNCLSSYYEYILNDQCPSRRKELQVQAETRINHRTKQSSPPHPRAYHHEIYFGAISVSPGWFTYERKQGKLA